MRVTEFDVLRFGQFGGQSAQYLGAVGGGQCGEGGDHAGVVGHREFRVVHRVTQIGGVWLGGAHRWMLTSKVN